MSGEPVGDIGALYARHAAAVHSYVLRRADRETAEEVTAQVFLVAWRRRSAVPEEALPWLYGVARRVLADQRRGASRRRRLAERLHAVALREQAVAAPADRGLADPALAEALGALSENDREALLLRYWEELEPHQIARALGCSVPAAAVRLHRARGRLRRELERRGGAERMDVNERAQSCAAGGEPA